MENRWESHCVYKIDECKRCPRCKQGLHKMWKLEISEDFRKVLQGYIETGDFEYVAKRFMELLK